MKLPAAVTPLADAEILTVVALETELVWAVNVTCDTPAAAVAVAGIDTALPPLTAVSVIVVLAFKGAKKLIVPVVALPPVTLEGLKLTADGPSASTVKPPVFLTPLAAADIDTLVLAERE